MSICKDCKPCPFCGGSEPEVCEDPNEGYWSVMCAYCDAEGPPGWDMAHYDKHKKLISTRKTAIVAWNRRSSHETKRFEGKTPCTLNGNCDLNKCNPPNRHCHIITIIEKKPMKTDTAVIIIGECLGF